MKILVVADSHGADSGKGTWIDQLRQLTGATIDCKGVRGCSNWVIYENFLKYYDLSYDYIFILLSNENRIPYVEGYPIYGHYGGTDVENSMLPPDYKIAFLGHLKWFYHMPLQTFISKGIVNELQQYPIEKHQKIIWINALIHPHIYDLVTTGLKVKGHLCMYSAQETIDYIKDNKELIKAIETGKIVDPRTNHFSEENQYELAKFYANIIEKDKNNTLTDADLELKNIDWVRDPQKLVSLHQFNNLGKNE